MLRSIKLVVFLEIVVYSSMSLYQKLISNKKEFIFQSLLVLCVLILMALDKDHPHLHFYEVLFIVDCLFVAYLIEYYLLPRFFYKKLYIWFAILIVLLLTIAALIDEIIIERFNEYRYNELSLETLLNSIQGILPFCAIFVGLKFAWDASLKQIEIEKLHSRVTESQLQFLTSQINPHFLFNNLNNLYSYALDNSPRTHQIILELSSLLRYMLYDCREKLVPLETEIKYLNDYIKLQELQIEDRGKISFAVSGELKDKYIAPLILIVFVENSFKHSTSSQASNIDIRVDISIVGDDLKLFCYNTFEIKKNDQNIPKGIGLENVKSRLDLLYPEGFNLDTVQKDNEFIINLDLKLNKLKQ